MTGLCADQCLRTNAGAEEEILGQFLLVQVERALDSQIEIL
jgi:hypothetical protein